MSIGPMMAPAVAGASLANAQAAQAERGREAAERTMQAAFLDKAEQAAGVGATDGEEHQTADRDADGRRLWERPLGGRPHDAPPTPADEAAAQPETSSAANDPTGDLGHGLDLVG